MTPDPRAVLLVSSSEKGTQAIRALLRDTPFSALTVANTAGEARRMAFGGRFDAVIVNAPLGDEFGTDLSIDLARGTTAGVLLVVRQELTAKAQAATELYGVQVQAKPFDRHELVHNMYLLASVRDRLAVLENENRRLKEKLAEIKLVGRAKHALIEQLGMTEPQAHRYIEKQAMDLRVSRGEVAETILKTYNETD